MASRGAYNLTECLDLFCFQLDNSQSHSANVSASFLHERVAQLEAAAQKNKFKVNIYYVYVIFIRYLCTLVHFCTL